MIRVSRMALGIATVVVISTSVIGCEAIGLGEFPGADSASQCDTYDGPNPSPIELSAARRASTEALYDLMAEAGIPTGPEDERELFIETNSRIFNDEIALALSAAPAGSVAAYTEHLCDPPVAADSPEAKQLLGDMSSQLEQFRSNPELADVDWDAAVSRVKDINREYAVIQAVNPLMVCGTAIKHGAPVDISSVRQKQVSPVLEAWIVEGWSLVCPDQMPAAQSAGVPGPQDCGTLPDKADSQVFTEATSMSCDEALDLISSYIEDPRTQRGDRGAQMGEWGCNILGASEVEELGYWLVCKSEGAMVTVRSSN